MDNEVMHKIKLNQLEILIEVVDAGSFSAAAIELGCTQSRISHAIAELETAVGARLLDRSRAGCTVTEAGIRVLHKARQMRRIAESVVTAATGDGDITAEVRIACFRSIGTHVLPLVLEALARDYPGIRVDVDDSADGFSAAIVKTIEQGCADIGIARRSAALDLVQLRYVHDTYCAVVPGHVALRASPSWTQFDGLPYILPHNADGASTLEACRAAGFQGKAARRMTNDIAILSMVSRGAGFTIMPRLATYPVPEGARMAELPCQLRRELALYMRPEVARLKAVKIVNRYLRDKSLIARTGAYRAGAIGFDF